MVKRKRIMESMKLIDFLKIVDPKKYLVLKEKNEILVEGKVSYIIEKLNEYDKRWHEIYNVISFKINQSFIYIHIQRKI